MFKKIKKKIDGDKKTIAVNFASLTTLQAANYILPLIVLPYLVRVLGPEKFGLVMFAQSLVMLFKMAVDFGFVISGTREISLAKNDLNKKSQIFSAIMTIKVSLTILAFFILVIIVELINRFTIDSDVYYLSFGLVIGNAIFPVWFFQGIEKMKFVTLINILAKVIFTILIFLFVSSSNDYILVPIFNSLGFIVAGLLGFLISLKYVRFSIPNFKMSIKLLRESFSLFIGKFATNFYTSFNVLILGFFVDNTIVGIYSSIEKLILAIKNMYGPLYQAIFPWLVKQNQLKRIKVVKKLMPIIFFGSLTLTIIILLFGNTILHIIYNDDRITSYGYIFKILSSIAIFAGMNMLFSNLYFPAIKKYNLRMNMFIATGILNLILSFILVPILDIKGTAISVSISEFFLLAIGAYYFIKQSKTL